MSKKSTTILDTPRKVIIPDVSGNGNHITMIVNWNSFIKDCEYIKLIMPNGDECIVQKDEFRSIIMLISKEEEIVSMGKTKIETVRSLTIPVKVKASRNYKAGEEIHAVVNYKFRIPQELISKSDLRPS